jgi:pimeloyl-ACP methyl ester carboxylesterase
MTDPLTEHRDRCLPFQAGGVASVVRDEGAGEAVVCLHGVPTFSYLYRKILPRLAKAGLRGVAFDFPGLGFADRPPDFDYSWSGLAAWTVQALDALEIERAHLVVHDLGGPVGFLAAHAIPDRIRSLTVLNTIVLADGFKKPWTMRPFGSPLLGPLWLGTMTGFAFVQLMYLQGVVDRSESPPEQLLPYLRVLKDIDGGAAFLKMMQRFETTAATEATILDVLGHGRPTQVIWGEHDPALPFTKHGLAAAAAAGVQPIRLNAKHFLQEDQYAAVADHIARLATGRS